jgi:hypothetical protein
MSEFGLTNEERRCLKLWFRQAMAEVEREEATTELIQWFGDGEGPGHRSQTSRRRTRRVMQTPHSRENILV